MARINITIEDSLLTEAYSIKVEPNVESILRRLQQGDDLTPAEKATYKVLMGIWAESKMKGSSSIVHIPDIGN